MRNICDWSEDEYLHLWSGDSASPLEYLPQLMGHRLDLAASMTRNYLDAATRYQNGAQRIAEQLIPTVKHCLAEACSTTSGLARK